MKKLIITGATSLIGIAVTKLAIQEGYDVTAIIRPNSKKKQYLPQVDNLTIVECNLTDYSGLTLNANDYDCFVHVAWDGTGVSMRNTLKLQVQNIDSELEAVLLAHRSGCKRFIGIGSQAEFGQHTNGTPTAPDAVASPESGYAIAKYSSYKMSKLLCRDLHMEHCWIRVFSVYGEYDQPHTLIMACLNAFTNNEPLELTPCDQLWDYIYVEDVADAILSVCEKGKDGAIYCLGSGHCMPLKEYVETIRALTDSQTEPYYGGRQYYPNQVMYLCADIRSLTEDTGFIPKYTFDEGIGKTIQWYRNSMENSGKEKKAT